MGQGHETKNLLISNKSREYEQNTASTEKLSRTARITCIS